MLCCSFYKALLENPGAEAWGLTFSVPATDFVGQGTEGEQLPGLGEVKVTDTNREVRCICIAAHLCLNVLIHMSQHFCISGKMGLCNVCCDLSGLYFLQLHVSTLK